MRKVILSIVFLASSLSGYCGVSFVASVADHGAGRRYRVPIAVEGARLKADTTMVSGGKGRTELLYASDRGLIWHLDHASRSYLEVNERAFTELGSGVAAAKDFLQDQMRRMGLDKSEPVDRTVTVEKTNQAGEFGGMRCTLYRVRQGGQHIQDLWCASWADAGIDRAAFTVPRRLLFSCQTVLPGLAGALPLGGLDQIPLGGILQVDAYPVRLIQYVNGSTRYDIQLGRPVTKDMNAAAFELPGGYTKDTL